MAEVTLPPNVMRDFQEALRRARNTIPPPSASGPPPEEDPAAQDPVQTPVRSAVPNIIPPARMPATPNPPDPLRAALELSRQERQRREDARGVQLPMPEAPQAPTMRPRNMQDDLRAAQAARAGDPEHGLSATAGDVVTEGWRAADAAATPVKPRSGSQRVAQAEQRRQDVSESRQWQRDYSKYEAEWQAWNTQLENALEAGDNARANKLRREEPQRPAAPASVEVATARREGLPSETEGAEMYPVDHDGAESTPPIAVTAYDQFKKLPADSQQALRALAYSHFNINPADVGPKEAENYVRRYLSMQFGEIHPTSRSYYDEDGELVHEPGRGEVMANAAANHAAIAPAFQTQVPRPESQRYARNRLPSTMADGTEGGIDRDTRTMEEKEQAWRRQAEGGTLGLTAAAPRDSAMGDVILDTVGSPVGQQGQAPSVVPRAGGELTRDNFPTQPERITPEWTWALDGIAGEFGVRRGDFAEGPDGDLQYRRTALRAINEHQRRVNMGYEVYTDLDGTRRYRPGQALIESRRATKLNRELKDFQRAHPLLDAYPDDEGNPTRLGSQVDHDGDPSTPDQFVPFMDQLRAAASAGNREEFIRIQRQARAASQDRRVGNVNRQTMLRGETQNVNNPAMNTAMFRRDLQAAGDDPAKQALVYRQWGNPDEADRILARSNQLEAIEAQAGIAAEARPKMAGDLLMAEDSAIIGAAMDNSATPDTLLERYKQSRGLEGDQAGSSALYGLARLMVSGGVQSSAGAQIIGSALENLWSGGNGAGWDMTYTEEEFVARAKAELGDGAGQYAAEFYRNKRGQQAPAQ